jgi:hypothetical protein
MRQQKTRQSSKARLTGGPTNDANDSNWDGRPTVENCEFGNAWGGIAQRRKTRRSVEGWTGTHFYSYSYVPLLEKANVPFIKFHSKRHTAASLALADGESVKLVSEMLGHSDASITLNVYPHVLPTQHRERADRMGQLLAGAAGGAAW